MTVCQAFTVRSTDLLEFETSAPIQHDLHPILERGTFTPGAIEVWRTAMNGIYVSQTSVILMRGSLRRNPRPTFA